MSKVVLITGASSGIGKETAKQLLQDGHVVYGAARRVEKMADLQALGVKVLALDVTEEQSMTEAVNHILKTEGRIDVLINNAGFGSYGAFEEMPMAEARYQMEVNVFGTARLTQLVLPAMIEHRFGRIINISSVGGKVALALGSWYHASKFALEALSDSLRNEVKQYGVDVVVIEPGGIQSEWAGIAVDNLVKVSGKGRYRQMVERYALRRTNMGENAFADPGVIAELIREAITAAQPQTRYAAGYLAEEVLSLRKQLSDRELDERLHSYLKIN
ncbi:oxidoreductase [Paraflavisolibacter sp. H34]|uniref:oxidoreductase n=1 Tax=Huijunlia imazamoxiresistens TaxID=3127457 RepID=UPI003019F267